MHASARKTYDESQSIIELRLRGAYAFLELNDLLKDAHKLMKALPVEKLPKVIG